MERRAVVDGEGKRWVNVKERRKELSQKKKGSIDCGECSFIGCEVMREGTEFKLFAESENVIESMVEMKDESQIGVC